MATRVAKSAPAGVLLAGNVLYALIDQAHVHHEPAGAWFAKSQVGFATCPITQETLLRLLMRLGTHSTGEALAVLQAVTANPRHQFWPDDLPYESVRWTGVMGHRQVTAAYLAALARQHQGKLATFDQGLAALHPDVAIALQA